MKIEEKFYTISEKDLKTLCKRAALKHQKGFDETEFEKFYTYQICDLQNNKCVGFLTFRINVNEIN